MSSAFSQLG
jgi:hypothetical protein